MVLMKRDPEESPRFFFGERVDLIPVLHAHWYQQGRCLPKERVWALFCWLLGAGGGRIPHRQIAGVAEGGTP
jgi:hypothetical protein